jgi:hypothetical protein
MKKREMSCRSWVALKVYIAGYGLLLAGLVALWTFPVIGETLVDANKASIDRMHRAIAAHDCPAQLDYQRDLPLLCELCPKKNGMVEQNCDNEFSACLKRRAERLAANNNYNAFLDAECTPAAKDRKAAKEAAAAKERARQIDQAKLQRDSQLAQSTSCHASKEICVSACSEEMKRNGRDSSTCNTSCKEGSLTLYCFRKVGSN